MTAVPFQKPGAPEAAGLTREQCEQAAWAVEPGGRRHRGAGAAHAALARGLGVRWVLSVYYLPIIQQIEDVVYRWIAANRGRLPGTTPYCERHPGECG
ncbi:MAG: hypothetical protein MAG451_00724 [Anaerolineales bacterium]|nr:hypothetical protein [Anaerolineales bacterium]